MRITKLATEIEHVMEKDFRVTLTNIKNMESKSEQYAKLMDVSINLGNNPHFDVNDAGPGISIWLMENPDNEHKEPYFILPNCSINGSKGVAIKLYHGIIIENK